MRSTSLFLTFAPWMLIGALSCSTPEILETNVTPAREFSLEEILNEKTGPVGCREMLDTYCSSLHSPEVQGNLSVGRGPSATLVLQGRTRNDFTSVYFFYAQAKLRARESLPLDFRQALDRQEYFPKLIRVLNRPPRARMSLDTRADSIRRELEVDRIWNSAIAETVLRRTSQKHSGYHRLRDDLVPIEQVVAKNRARNELISEISRAIWKRDRNWAKVETNFEILRQHYLSVIKKLEIPDDLKQEWQERIKSVKLAIPGATPAIADAECSTTQANAYYYSHLNIITVCAGDFNTEDILQTVAHELGHALDLDRSRYLAQRESEFGKKLHRLRAAVCAPKKFSCQDWTEFQEGFDSSLSKLSDYTPELPEFQRCLKRRVTKKTLNSEHIRRLAEREVNEKVSGLASSGLFLRITKESFPLPNGKTARNPNHLNPCNYRIWSQGEEPIDHDLYQLLYFTAEYRCNATEPKERLREAIAKSREMATRVTEAVLKMEGEFSPRDGLEAEGFGSSPSERFADVLGSYAFASYLNEIQNPWTRRHVLLASSSWQCSRPSLATLYPDESRIQQGFVFDPHSETDERKKELFTQPIQKAVQCTPDFEFRACELKMSD